MHSHQARPLSIEITVRSHEGIRGRCSQCQRPAPGYDRLPERLWRFVPLWGISTKARTDRKSTRLNSSHFVISYAVFCLKKKTSELQSLAYLVCRLLS